MTAPGIVSLYEVRKIGGRVFCVTGLNALMPEGTAGEVRHYTERMVRVVEVEGRWEGTKFVLPFRQVANGELIATRI